MGMLRIAATITRGPRTAPACIWATCSSASRGPALSSAESWGRDLACGIPEVLSVALYPVALTVSTIC